MQRQTFLCTLRSDVVLSSSSATEGGHDSLDFIPGVKFLGIAAKKLYDMNNPEATLRRFHSGEVRFGNAYPACGQQQALPMPYSWRSRKLKQEGAQDIFLFGRMSKEDEQQVSAEGQLQQMRKGFIAQTGEGFVQLSAEHDYSIKAGYDSEKRRAQDSQMYGYTALRAGSQWIFQLDAPEGDLPALKEALCGLHTIGRSRTAQYGMVHIETLEAPKAIEAPATCEAGGVWVYAASDCAFFDAQGNPTLQPTAEQLGLPAGSCIDYAKSQVRTRRYSNWNAYRNTPDTEREVVCQGSVWVCVLPEGTASFTPADTHVGAYKAEGLGAVRYNPHFLAGQGGTNPALQLGKGEQDRYTSKAANKPASALAQWVQQRDEQSSRLVKLSAKAQQDAEQYAAQFKGIEKSQWGRVRAAARHSANVKALDTFLFHEKLGYLEHGIAEHKWRKGKGTLKELIEKTAQGRSDQDVLAYVEMFASEMAK